MPAPAREEARARRRATAVLAAAGAGLLLVWHFGSVRDRGGLVDALLNAGHLPLFAALTLIVLGLVRRIAAAPGGRESAGVSDARVYATTLATMLVLAVGTELIQGLLPQRIASRADVGVNLLGITAGFALAAVFDRRAPVALRRPTTRIVLAVAGVVACMMVLGPLTPVLAAHAKRTLDFPVLVRFDTALDLRLIRAPNADAVRAALPSPWRNPGEAPSLRVDLRQARYPGVTVVDPARDWRGHAALELDLTNPEDRPLALTLRINDADHSGAFDDRYNRHLILPPASRERISIPLAEIRQAPAGRSMDMARIATLILFATSAEAGRRFYLTRVALVGQVAGSFPRRAVAEGVSGGGLWWPVTAAGRHATHRPTSAAGHTRWWRIR